MEQRTITISEFIKGGLEPNVQYTLTKDKPLKLRIEHWFRDKGWDSYSRSVKRDYRKGITKDLRYKDTIDKCEDEQHIRLIWVNGYSDLMKLKEPHEINKNIEFKINKLVSEGKVGYLDGDSCGCYLACRKSDYAGLCKYLKVEYDDRDDDKDFYYNSLFDDVRLWFHECCDVVDDIRECMNEKQWDDFDKTLYDVARYVIVHIERYKDILLSAREYNEDTKDEHWVNRLWNVAYNDMKGGK